MVTRAKGKDPNKLFPRIGNYLNVLKHWDTKTINFSFVPNEKLMVLPAPIFKHNKVCNIPDEVTMKKEVLLQKWIWSGYFFLFSILTVNKIVDCWLICSKHCLL